MVAINVLRNATMSTVLYSHKTITARLPCIGRWRRSRRSIELQL
ncbi:hypothetical protein L831_4814 [Mycobacteroides abscessus MAB_082312_2272]|nr:hypothetical protein L830_3642 [Mycobacteroides abscessus MAB_082312_2258]ETZ79633.1 hypothetical protein L831_4814 [Mycobacteroides abscessus MAB_082312_2272]